MNALVIYDSMFGNTEQIARAIGAELAKLGMAEVLHIDKVSVVPTGLDLLVVGGPTQGHGVDPEEKEFLDHLSAPGYAGRSGSAAKGIEREV